MAKEITIKKEKFKKLYDIACINWKSKFDEKFKNQVFSDTLDFDEDFLLEMKNACTSEQMPVFIKIFKKFLPTSVLDIIKYSEVCKRLGEAEITLDNFINLPKLVNIKKLVAIARVDQLMRFFNGNGEVDFNNKNQNQRKWIPYFEKKSSGWVFCYSDYHFFVSFAWVGLYKDEETANHIGRNFLEEIYSDLL